MSNLHLGPNSEKPPEVKGQARLYSMKYCPFSHRIRLILCYKKIPHDIVNINIQNKPKWFFEIHPEGKVPAFVDADGKVVVDSLQIANYLDEKYPEPPLYHEETKAKDLELLDHFSKVVNVFSNCIHGKDNRPLNEIIADISTLLVPLEDELKARGSVYFGGVQPGMLDVLMWPWVERRKSLSIIYDQPKNFKDGNFQHLMKWMQEMKQQPFVLENECSSEKFAQLVKDSKRGDIDFDRL
ncbi:pyrimidodiazepine synthase [Xylocopa sonorina]|uniref:pyrimidodiazepine synthase n=1 Tax=Xylocopa sonorina TaxID=1818115 RepID=UPI00403B2B0E